MNPLPRALVMAKAPVPGRVKTRLGHEIGMDTAAGLASAALLDTLDACTAAFGADRCHLALDGELGAAVGGELIVQALAGWAVTTQRGDTFAVRLVNAHADLAATAPGPVVQIGMDTPQVTAQLLSAAAAALGIEGEPASSDAVLGAAPDGGWWVLALRDSARAGPLAGVAMSTPTTCTNTRAALTAAGLRVTTTTTMRDVDTVSDAVSVAHEAPDTRFARAWNAVAGLV
ncbi:DUF2064 domain-containing protein [Nocardioides sp.]|uniref:TIGR04282 family arsenosugar biosynthesis glycosyltransferase n=1 Tax=Nocardioides sp. TaxID=35761 RepID=UPI00286DA133|nr:DUF2064 domain-containing protein [Nocardioides sp.]